MSVISRENEVLEQGLVPILSKELESGRPVSPTVQCPKQDLKRSIDTLWSVIDQWFGARPLLIKEVVAETAERSGVIFAKQEWALAAYWRLVADKKILREGKRPETILISASTHS